MAKWFETAAMGHNDFEHLGVNPTGTDPSVKTFAICQWFVGFSLISIIKLSMAQWLKYKQHWLKNLRIETGVWCKWSKLHKWLTFQNKIAALMMNRD